MAVLAATAVAVAASPRPGPAVDAGRPAKPRPAISIAGKVGGLYPGAAKRVRLRLRNRSSRVRIVTSVRARSLDAGPRCSAKNLRMKKRRVRLRIPARSKRRLGFLISMIPGAADGCQGASFPIRYRARVR